MRKSNFLKLILNWSMIVGFFLFGFSCKDPTNNLPEDTPKPIQEPVIESIFANVIKQTIIQKNGIPSTIASHVLEVALSGNNLPDKLFVKGYWLNDTGSGNDLIAGDHIYSSETEIVTKFKGLQGVSKHFQLYGKSSSSIETERSQGWWIKCTGMKIVQVGQKCEDGTCPERSITGGQTWFCLCFGSCDFCLGDCDDKDDKEK